MEIQRIDLGFVNAYLIRTGQGFVLIDSGVPASRQKLEAALLDAGCGAGQLKLVIVTHGDIDHAGNCAHLQDKFGARIAMHDGDAERVIKGDFSAPRQGRGLVRRLLMPLVRRSRRYRRMLADFECFTPDLLLQDGQALQEFGLDAQVLHIPGHTAGSLGILTGEGDLIAGDTLNNQGRPQGAVLVADAGQLAASLARLKGLGIRTVYPGHGRPFAMRDLR